MSRKIYLIEEDVSSCGECMGNGIIAAFFSKEKAEKFQLDLKAEEIIREERSSKCFNCGSIRAGVVKNKKTFVNRAKQLCNMADFVPEDIENDCQYLNCLNEVDGYDNYHYYIRETELMDD